MAVSLTNPPQTRTEAKYSHISDSSVLPFLQNDFDPADYLNSSLPTLSTSTAARNTQGSQHGRAVQLPELSTQLQSLLSQLNAQTSRLSNTLTQLTDEIIRSGGRLAYEVEVLRGETIGLTDSLENGLRKDIEVFVSSDKDGKSGTAGPADEEVVDGQTDRPHSNPAYLGRLKTLTAVRSRLDAVIKVFGDAMQWPIAPSELSLTSSIISVSAPDASDDSRGREEKGKAYAEKLRNKINDLIGSGNDISSLEVAAERIDDLRRLADVWKGTAEEKARLKLVESLQKPVEDRLRALEQVGGGKVSASSPARGIDYRYGNMESTQGGYGFLQNLRNLKNDMYLD